ncbi:hypothetical protein [Pseudomonas japonica]|uniref:hypothetical protein n=1 Tax=Pseudomonas japonica TaxID=256466 RepID=UPI0015E31E12|nr:hypothetical protein [Pseudomonas japonica]MBA1290570.1 hypothetical protein [Pseudomonas japonica]
MAQWYCKSFEQEPRAFLALKRLRELGLGLHGIPQHQPFYKVALDAETATTKVFVLPGYMEVAQAFGAQPCEPPSFGPSLSDVTVLPLPCLLNHVHSPTCRKIF